MSELLLYFLFLMFMFGLYKIYLTKMTGKRALLIHNIQYFINLGDDFTYKRTKFVVLILTIIYLIIGEISFSIASILSLVLYVSVGMIIDITSEYIAFKYSQKKFAGIKNKYVNQAKKIEEILNSIPFDDPYEYEEKTIDMEELIIPYITEESKVLSMSNDGAEFITSIPIIPEDVIVIDERLGKAVERTMNTSMKVKSLTTNRLLPVEDNSLDTILCKETNFSAKDVYRALKQDGTFVIMQNSGQYAKELIGLYYPLGMDLSWDVNKCSSIITSGGFKIISKKEVTSKVRFNNFASVMNYAVKNKMILKLPIKVIENISRLSYMYDKIEQEGFYEVTLSYFYIIAKKI